MIAAEGELQASKALGHAARTVVDCPQALQVSSSLSASIFTFKTNPLTNPSVPYNLCIGAQISHLLTVLNVKMLIGAFNHEKALDCEIFANIRITFV